MANGVTVAVMAGGKSTRMGRDKSFVPFDGRPLIEVVLAAVRDLGDELLLITNNPDAYAHLSLPMVGDIFPDHGPLGGIYTAVATARQPHTLIVACDMPWLNRDLLAYQLSLRHEADVVVPRWRRFPEPLHAVYSKACLPAIAAKLRQKQLKIAGFFDEVAVRFVKREEIARFDKDGRSFANVNTPEELARQQPD